MFVFLYFLLAYNNVRLSLLVRQSFVTVWLPYCYHEYFSILLQEVDEFGTFIPIVFDMCNVHSRATFHTGDLYVDAV